MVIKKWVLHLLVFNGALKCHNRSNSRKVSEWGGGGGLIMGCMVFKAVIKISSCRASDIRRRGIQQLETMILFSSIFLLQWNSVNMVTSGLKTIWLC